MARVNIPITSVTEIGTAQPAAITGDAANDHYIAGGTDILVECKNSGTVSAGTVTFVTSYATAGGLALSDNDVVVAAGSVSMVKLRGRQVLSYYEQDSDSDYVYVNVTSNLWQFRAYNIA